MLIFTFWLKFINQLMELFDLNMQFSILLVDLNNGIGGNGTLKSEFFSFSGRWRIG